MLADRALRRMLHRAMTKRKNNPRKGPRQGPNTSKKTGPNTGPNTAPKAGHHGPPREAPAPATAPPHGSPNGSLWLYGLHPVLAALANPKRQHLRLVVSREQATGLRPRLIEALKAAGKTDMTAEVLDKKSLAALLPPAAVHQGLALSSRLPEQPGLEALIDRIGRRERAVLVILDQASDPHNIGAVLRSAAAFGALALVLPDRHTPEVTGVMAKAASGALERLPIIRVGNLVRTMTRLKDAGFWCIGLDGNANTPLPEADLAARTALVLGAEGSGLRRLTREHCDLLVKIPIGAAVESLNLSNAAALALYEYTRRNR